MEMSHSSLVVNFIYLTDYTVCYSYNELYSENKYPVPIWNDFPDKVDVPGHRMLISSSL